MGHSLYNKIYLGRRTALYNRKRMGIAALCTASLAAAVTLLALVR
ncbi:hypothetical protein [Janthinobacterium sp. 17J80-10]|nr:hypothetical protein [Janthinobacterium sp. 17J80-10]